MGRPHPHVDDGDVRLVLVHRSAQRDNGLAVTSIALPETPAT
ncbi:hypothetical protein [Streptosporangium sp. NPDC002607]